jgi:virginiamycin B lyase
MTTLRLMAFAALALACAMRPALPADVSYYDVPRGSHPHDVAPGPDGTVWYTAQMTGALGILDPKSGRVTQVKLGADSAPHGVIAGPDRAAWITDGGQNAIARVDPVSKAVKLFPLPKEFSKRQPQYGDVRPEGDSLVHRAERRLRARRSGERQG